MKKTSKAFSLIEVLLAILLLSFISLFLLPSLGTNLDLSRKTKDTADTSFVLQEAIETSRNKKIGNYIEEINGKNINISIEKYNNPSLKGTYKKIRASYGEKTFELIEAYNEKGI
ncbi:prepilin-type N-terminal cleavage/methylation domain-containing protein [uncultured Anaerococcus sp.]|uniref:prepilin-type N-terminal cleavage/methylation domain-containing protein n=1 Tax=uncultured Anaerococcus sp. TaxID=293428 RepID=UPI00288A817D|nr:prepilin-type N-terminal cleavage/methylation domain-containing protein [uncultured Anaerococcus sp.]